MNSINDLWAILGDDKALLDDCISQSAQSPIDLSNQVSDYMISSGGKRIRPLVLLLLARALNYKGHLQYQLATAVEFIHIATLLHDDVVDESDRRRNQPSVNKQFGNAAAVLVGDFLYTRAFQIISQKLNAARIIADATNELAMGEGMQLMNVNSINL
ncbi:MAG: polyprenyl synthetase family protein, partial [Ostreibacterium sp.]